MNSLEEVEHWLREGHQLDSGPATLTPLTGGVSCEIYKVVQGDRTFVVKRALPKLRVAAEWFADVSRNAVEYDFYREMGQSLGGSIPRVLFHNPQRGYFVMEYLGDEWRNWKDLLMRGVAEPGHGTLAGVLMGQLHGITWNSANLAALFDTTANFRQLRTDPFLRATAGRWPELRADFFEEADRLENSRICLVHGDFSPKNLLIRGQRMILLDAEVAWYGDPAFDVAFLQTHLFLKWLHFQPEPNDCLRVAEAAWKSYGKTLGAQVDAAFEKRSVRLLAMLLLARVDGKSPVEYLSPAKQQLVRKFIRFVFHEPISLMEDMRVAWRNYGLHL